MINKEKVKVLVLMLVLIAVGILVIWLSTPLVLRELNKLYAP